MGSFTRFTASLLPLLYDVWKQDLIPIHVRALQFRYAFGVRKCPKWVNRDVALRTLRRRVVFNFFTPVK
jgi:hypothetical protein